MSARKEYLTRVFSDFLARKTVPRDFAGNEKAQDAEFSALIRTVLKSAPEINYQEWWPRFEDAVDSMMQTRVWPSVNQLRGAAKLVSKGRSAHSDEWSMDTVQINARRVRNREALGDEWFFGTRAVQLIQQAGITEDDLTPYRSGLWFSILGTYGENAARVRESEYRKKHDDAREAVGMPPIFSGASLLMGATA